MRIAWLAVAAASLTANEMVAANVGSVGGSAALSLTSDFFTTRYFDESPDMNITLSYV